jgi:hypothetical protein
MASSSGFTVAKAAASPPTMMERVPLMAPISPPLTGASSIVAPREAARPASRRATSGAILLQSMTIVPRCRALKTPSGPSSTRSTSGESGTIVKMRVACRATSAGELARAAPAATTSSTGSGLRLCTTSGNPAFNRFFAMGRPISPSPMNPIVSAMARSIVRAELWFPGLRNS